LLTTRRIIVNKETRKHIVDIQLQNLLECLDGTLTRQTVIDSKGNTSKRIIITYNEETH